MVSKRRSERTLHLWASPWSHAIALCAVFLAILGHCLPAHAAVTRTGTLHSTVAENLSTRQSTTRFTLKSGGETTVLLPTDLAADTGDRVAVTGTERGDRLVGTVASIGPSPPEGVEPGPRKTAVVLVTFPGDPTSPWSLEETRSKVFTATTSVNAFYHEESYGAVSLTGKLRADGDVFGWLHLDTPGTGCAYEQWRRDAEDAAAAAGIDLSGYDHVAYMFPRRLGCTWEGIAGVVPGGMMLNGNQSVQVIAHELGHTLGLEHAGSWTCTSGGVRVQISDDCTMTQYGDPFDIMGNISTRHSNGEALEKMGFISPGNVKTIDHSGVYTLHSALHPTSEPTALRIRRSKNIYGDISYYYFEVREQGGIFENVSDATTTGVSIRVTGESYTPETLLIDANPATATFQDAPLGVGQTFADGPVLVKTLSASAGAASVEIEVDEAAPSAPTGLEASAEFATVRLKWNPSSDNFGVERYLVYRDGIEIRSTTNTEFLDGEAAAGQHTYRVYAEDAAGNRSAASLPATATLELDEVAPTAPTELTATAGVEGVWLEWEESSDGHGVERYPIYRDGEEIGETGRSTEFLDSIAAAGDHTYVVFAEDAARNRSAASAPASATLEEREGPECESGTCSVSFWHTGAPSTWTVPPGVVKAKFTVEGAQGGDHGSPDSLLNRAARVGATLAPLAPGDEVTLSVGGMGRPYAQGGAGGFGGGGDGTLGGGGGGYSSVKLGPNLMLLAAGGGGAGLAGANALTGDDVTGGFGGHGGESGTPGASGAATQVQGATLGGGGSGGAGAGGASGGDGGQVAESSSCQAGVHAGEAGAAGAGFTGGGGAPGAGGGGGGGYLGGGQGGGGAGDGCGSAAGSGGGGGGSSFAASGVSATFLEGIRNGYGRVTISYASPVKATEHNYTTPPGQTLVVPAAEGALVGASGPDGLPLTLSLLAQPFFGSVELAGDGSFIYTPPPGHLGGAFFDFLVTEPAGNYAIGRAYIEIAAPPSASISAPTTGASYEVGKSVSTAFTCAEGEGGTGLESCNDSSGKKTASGGTGKLDTSTPGSHTYTVTAVSSDGLTDTESISYTVEAAPKSPEGPKQPEEPKKPPVGPQEPPPPPEPPPKLEISLSIDGGSLRDLLRTRKLVVATRVSAATSFALVGRAKLRRGRRDAQPKLVPVFARKTVAFAEPGEREVTLVLTRQGREALRRLSTVRLAIDASATGTTGEVASTVAVTLSR